MMQASKRVAKDYKDFVKNPIPGCHVRPREDSIMLWDVIMSWCLDKDITAPLHLIISFPDTYPNAAPSVGFSVSTLFYQDGAGKFVLHIFSILLFKI